MTASPKHSPAHGDNTLPNLRGRRTSKQPFREIFGLTHQGHVRDHNEDHYLVLDVERCVVVRQSSLQTPSGVPGTTGTLLVVADGMGGHSNGELASAVTLDTVAAYAARSMPVAEDHPSVVAALRAGFQAAALECQRRLREVAQRKGQPTDLGTTLTALYAAGDSAEIAHVGDSRAYALRSDGQLWQLTRDHTVAGQLEPGQDIQIAPRFANVLTNAIGGSDEAPRVDGYAIELNAQDRLLLCSDGLTKHLDDEQIRETLAAASSAREAAEQLVARTLETDATDNVTVVTAFV